MFDVTCANNCYERVTLFARKIACAKRVFVTGHSVTEAPARAMASRLICQGIDARFLDNQNKGEVHCLLTALPPEECLLVAYGITPVGASTLSIARFCAQLNMEIVCVTDAAPSPLNELASVSLACNVRLMNLFNSMFTVFLMNDAIALSLFLELDARQGGAVRDDAELRALRRLRHALVGLRILPARKQKGGRGAALFICRRSGRAASLCREGKRTANTGPSSAFL
jgi:DNA-binding MurR/RpiR family transcriptional regulator